MQLKGKARANQTKRVGGLDIGHRISEDVVNWVFENDGAAARYETGGYDS